MRFILFTLVFCWVSGFGHLSAQTYVVSYVRYNIGQGLLPSPNAPLEHQKVMKETKKRRRYYALKVVNDRSSFLPDYSALAGKRDPDLRYFVGDMQVYKDFSAGYIYRFAFFLDKGTAIRDSISGFMYWDLGDAADTVIAGFHCRSATGWFMGRNGKSEVRAWYAPQIPVMDGPDIYAGLPGLIMKLETGTFTYEAIDVRVGGDTATIEIPTAQNYITTKAYLTGDRSKIMLRIMKKVREFDGY